MTSVLSKYKHKQKVYTLRKTNNKLKTNKPKAIVGGRFGFKNKKISIFQGKNKWIALAAVILIAGAGVYYLYFAKADTPGCQAENETQICGIFEVNNGEDTIISTEPEARYLKDSGWATQWWGLIFQAPTTAYNGAVPIHRVGNVGATWHDWVTDSQKAAKEAKYGALSYEGVVFYAWDHQVPGTIPIYRMTMGGSGSKAFFVNNKALVDQWMANDLNWKLGEHMPAIAFYAYPPDYKVAGKPNPYDCSVLANYNSDRCKKERENLSNAVNNPDVDPKTLMPKPKAQPIPEQAAPKPTNTTLPKSGSSSGSTSSKVSNTQKKAELDKKAKELEGACTEDKKKANADLGNWCIAAVQSLAKEYNAINAPAASAASPARAKSSKQRDCSVNDKTDKEIMFCTVLLAQAVQRSANFVSINNAIAQENKNKSNKALRIETGYCTISGIRGHNDFSVQNISRYDCIAIAQGVRKGLEVEYKKRGSGRDELKEIMNGVKSNLRVDTVVSLPDYENVHNRLVKEKAFNWKF